MKIGILTFHWATNYGAVLQCYALQTFLESLGHEVEIINYKPRKFDFWFKYLKRPWLILRLYKDLISKKKENHLASFRHSMLNQTVRYHSMKELRNVNFNYDVVISGSDQVLNPSYTLGGEDCPTSAYYLEPFRCSKRIGYAISFGCEVYPTDALHYSQQWISSFNQIGVRENTGLSVLKQMGYDGFTEVVPDPTILLGNRMFKGIHIKYPDKKDYLCVYILRRHIDLNRDDAIYIDDYNNPLSMEEWIGTIRGSKGLITNSYHGMIVALLSHVPFVVIADAKNMNDRFHTLLSKIGLLDHILENYNGYETIIDKPLDWSLIDDKLSDFRNRGVEFLNTII